MERRPKMLDFIRKQNKSKVINMVGSAFMRIMGAVVTY